VEAANLGRQPAEAGPLALVAAPRQKLGAEANTEERRLFLDHPAAQRLDQPARLELAHSFVKMADPRQDDPLRAQHVVAARGDVGLAAGLLEHVLDGCEVAGSVVDDENHGPSPFDITAWKTPPAVSPTIEPGRSDVVERLRL